MTANKVALLIFPVCLLRAIQIPTFTAAVQVRCWMHLSMPVQVVMKHAFTWSDLQRAKWGGRLLRWAMLLS
ncbi:MAG: hypothetical protein A2X72_20645 [Burkholderiales bacterium GWF1_66_17]|nr:MAG: hypothetical protein A2X73_03070 [Burkholderiales bacterium GWE1_65_30]OGA93486.1 MAG: hypothetical protein A2X72_20645 [Burkholderiales bacterium GWF1_66_17]